MEFESITLSIYLNQTTLSCHHDSIDYITHSHHKKITRTITHIQNLRILNSRFALEHRYSATFTPEGIIESKEIVVAVNKFRDLAGGFNVEPSSTFLWHHDATVPTMSVTCTQGESGFYSADTSIDLTFTSSESTTTFTVEDIRTDGLGTISSFQEVSPTTYTAIFSPNDVEGAKYIHVNAGWYQDAASNENEASNTFVWNYDATRPTITISSDVVSAYVIALSRIFRLRHSNYISQEKITWTLRTRL